MRKAILIIYCIIIFLVVIGCVETTTSTTQEPTTTKYDIEEMFDFTLSETEEYYLLEYTNLESKNVIIPSEYQGLPVKEIIGGFNKNTILEYVFIPNTIEVIQGSAFMRCYNLNNVEFEENSRLKAISYQTFSYANIEEITIPSSVEILYARALYNAGIKRVFFESDSNLKTIYEFALGTELEEITIPGSVTLIKSRAFYGNKLSTITFEEGTEELTIESYAFENQILLNEITLPRRTSYVGSEILLNCTNVTISIYENNPYTVWDSRFDVIQVEENIKANIIYLD